jgi:K+-transporting ATPase ATPase B chain
MTVIASTGGLPQPRKRRRQSSLYDPAILVPAVGASFRKLNPRVMARNPVMFVVEVGAVITTYVFITGFFNHGDQGFVGQVCLWLWFTVLFANFAEAVAEGRGKAQAASLRQDAFGHHRPPSGGWPGWHRGARPRSRAAQG